MSEDASGLPRAESIVITRASVLAGVVPSAVVELLECVTECPRVSLLTAAVVATVCVGTAPMQTGVCQRALIYVICTRDAGVPGAAVAVETAESVYTHRSVLTRPQAVVYVLFTPLSRVPGGTHTGVAVGHVAGPVYAVRLTLAELWVRTGPCTVCSGIAGGTHTLVARYLILTRACVLTGVMDTALVDWNVAVFAGIAGVTVTGIVSDLKGSNVSG